VGEILEDYKVSVDDSQCEGGDIGGDEHPHEGVHQNENDR
jgi:hypothetical protein